MPDPMLETMLPNGQPVYCLREEETLILYGQIQEYFQLGIAIHPGDTIFDVGANIGLFTLQAYREAQGHLRIYAFEPIPAIFRVLQANAQRIDPEQIAVFPCGLADEAKSASFAYFPNATSRSSLDIEDLPEVKRQITRDLLTDRDRLPEVYRWILRFPPFLHPFLIRVRLEITFQTQRITCPLTTLSAIIREHAIERIDLLKIDVEKAELDVLNGIETADWPKIQQIVIEVHDIDRRVQTITDRLEANGFSTIKVGREADLAENNIVNLYAVR